VASPGNRADPTTKLLAARVRDFFRYLPVALAGNEEAVHQLRVTGRRLRVALPLLARKPQGKRLRRGRKRLRELVRTAGGSRDLDVSLSLFEARLPEGEALTPAHRTLRRRLRGACTRTHTRMGNSLLDLDLASLRRDLRRIVARRGDGLFVVFARLREARDLDGAALLQELRALGDRYEPVALHRLRIRARHLRYLAELVAALKDQPSRAPGLLKELQDHLGRIHDTHVLAEWLARQAEADAARGRVELAAAARRMEAAQRAASRALHTSLVEHGPAQLLNSALEAMGFTRHAA
jgi:CHAD domain-containing protein